MKHLPKHLQPRWRYLAVGLESWPPVAIDRATFQRELWYTAQNLLGDTGSAAADLSVLSFTHGDGSGEALVRVRRGEVERARSVLACVDAVGDAPVGLSVRGVSGTVRACEEKYMGRGTEEADQRDVVFGTAEWPAFVRDGRVDVRADGAFVGATTTDLQ